MKINEVTEVNEAPVSAIKQKAQSIGSRVLNKVGAKNKAANLAGKADFGATANKLFQQFNSYLGTQDKSLKQATGQDLAQFLKSKKVTRTDIPNGVLQKAQLDSIFQDVAKQAMQKQQGAGAVGKPVDKDGDGKDDATGKPIPKQAAVDKDGDGKDDATGKPMPKQAKPRVPAALLKALKELTPEEKKQLAELL